MRFVEMKGEDRQGFAVLLRTREILIWQRTQTINALRGHLAEFGVIVSKGASNITKLVSRVNDSETSLPHVARTALNYLTDSLSRQEDQINELNREIASRANANEPARRLMTIPEIGPLSAVAMVAFAPAPETFRRGRNFPAWLGPTPRWNPTGGKQRLGATTKMGERSLRRLQIIGANSVVMWRSKKGAAPGTWLERIHARKTAMLVRVALANKMARIVWAIMSSNQVYRTSVAQAS